jgi:hypothetical protein
MARSARDTRLETRTARLNLKKRIWHSAVIGKGSALAYRRGFQGFGSWHLRSYLGNHDYEFELLGDADDFQDADGVKVLNYFQAMEKARVRDKEKTQAKENTQLKDSLTVAKAAELYMEWFRENKKSYCPSSGIGRFLHLQVRKYGLGKHSWQRIRHVSGHGKERNQPILRSRKMQTASGRASLRLTAF